MFEFLAVKTSLFSVELRNNDLKPKHCLSVFKCEVGQTRFEPRPDRSPLRRRLNECKSNFKKLREGFKGKKFWHTSRQMISPERAPRVSGQLFGVRLQIFNFKF